MSTEKSLAPAAGPHAQTGLYASSKSVNQLRDGKVRYRLRTLREKFPELRDCNEQLLRSFVQVSLLIEQVYAALRDGGFVNTKGKPRRLLDDWRKLIQAQALLATTLGFTPQARRALGITPRRIKQVDPIAEGERQLEADNRSETPPKRLAGPDGAAA